MIEIVFKTAVTVVIFFGLVIFWKVQVDVPATFYNWCIKPIQDFISDPSAGWIVSRDSNKIYNLDREKIGDVSGEVIEEGQGTYLFTEISDMNFLLPPKNFIIEWNRKKLRFISVEAVIGINPLRKERNIYTNARFQKIDDK